MADILGAVYDWVKVYLPSMDVVRGWQNRAALPNASSYVVLTLLNHVRHGTNIVSNDKVTPPEGIDETTSELMEYEVQIDVCGTDEEAVSRDASILSMMGRSRRSVDFFRPLGIGCHFADDPRSVPFQDDKQWVARYSVTLHLTQWVRFTAHDPAFERVSIHIENVDVHHPVND